VSSHGTDTAQQSEPPGDCRICPRLSAFRDANIEEHSGWFNAPVPSFGPADARVLIVGLAPGLKGANKTGRPFTGDYAGDLLYATLEKFNFSSGGYAGHADDGLALNNCMITNAVRCVPPQNKPTGEEERHCRPFLAGRIAAMPRLSAILALGRIPMTTRWPHWDIASSPVNLPIARFTGLMIALRCSTATIAPDTTRTRAGLRPRCSRMCL